MSDDTFSAAIGADPQLQERLWFWERIGWGLMLLLVLAALAGLTGTRGPLSSGTAEAGGATVEYPRISRWQAADSLNIEFAEGSSGKVEVLLPEQFIDIFTIESVVPQPSSMMATPDGQLFTFDLAQVSGRKSASFSIRAGRPSFPTSVRGEVAAEPFDFSFTVLP